MSVPTALIRPAVPKAATADAGKSNIHRQELERFTLSLPKIGITVGTASYPSLRTDPGVQNYRTGLLNSIRFRMVASREEVKHRLELDVSSF